MKKIYFLMLLIVHFTFNIEHCMCQWVKYTNPPPGATVNDIVFFDVNTGLMAFNDPTLYRTTDGGNNWTYLSNIRIYYFQKIDSSIVYGWGRPNLAYDRIYRSFNKGLTWDSVAITGNSYAGFSFVNKDTGWISGFDGGRNQIWKTINGGVTLQVIPNSLIIGWGKIFFLKYKINNEYYGWCENDFQMYRTTNSGNNWYQVGNAADALTQLTFINENTGWASNGLTSIYKTTNGGIKWDTINMPWNHYIRRFCVVGNQTLYGDYGEKDYGGGRYKGIIWKSTNGGINWGYQQPDTSYPYIRYEGIYFLDSLHGWSSLIRTTNGGGTIMKITNSKEQIINNFILYQNYPNPFNQCTNIKYDLPKDIFVSVKIYDLLGREIKTLVNEYKNAGSYLVSFNGSEFASGVYFYRIQAGDFVSVKRMVLLK
jgi:photosystem II stability/assembly factor-like uncharacterized protein